MDDRSFLTGLELGRYLTALSTRISRLERGMTQVRGDVDTMKAHARRFGILATLWTFALLANVSSDRAAEFAVEIAMAALKR